MAEATPAYLCSPLAEVIWDPRFLRRLRTRMVWQAVIVSAVLGAGALWFGLRREALLLGGLWLLWKGPLLYLLFFRDIQERVTVGDTGLYVKTERSESFFPWDEVEGFTGVLHRRPGPFAPWTTTGGISSSLVLHCGRRKVYLGYPTGGDLPAVMALIEQRLIAHSAQG